MRRKFQKAWIKTVMILGCLCVTNLRVDSVRAASQIIVSQEAQESIGNGVRQSGNGAQEQGTILTVPDQTVAIQADEEEIIREPQGQEASEPQQDAAGTEQDTTGSEADNKQSGQPDKSIEAVRKETKKSLHNAVEEEQKQKEQSEESIEEEMREERKLRSLIMKAGREERKAAADWAKKNRTTIMTATEPECSAEREETEPYMETDREAERAETVREETDEEEFDVEEIQETSVRPPAGFSKTIIPGVLLLLVAVTVFGIICRRNVILLFAKGQNGRESRVGSLKASKREEQYVLEIPAEILFRQKEELYRLRPNPLFYRLYKGQKIYVSCMDRSFEAVIDRQITFSI